MPFVFLGVGLAAGVASGLFGIGGGVLIVPLIVWLARMPIKTATGTSLAALLLPVGLLGAREYWKTGNINVTAAAYIAGGILLGAFLGARYAQGLAPATLQRAFAIFLAVLAVRMWFKSA